MTGNSKLIGVLRRAQQDAEAEVRGLTDTIRMFERSRDELRDRVARLTNQIIAYDTRLREAREYRAATDDALRLEVSK
jgi:hypothetical protein